MTIAVELQLRRLNVEADDTLRRLAELDDMLFAEVNGIPLATIFVEDGADIVNTVLRAVRRISYHVPEAAPIRVNPDLVSMSDVADRVGVSREAVRKWINREANAFPSPFGCVGARQLVWQWADVNSWLKTVKSIVVDEDLPPSSVVDQINAHLNKSMQYLPARRAAVAQESENPQKRVILLGEEHPDRSSGIKHGSISKIHWNPQERIGGKLHVASTTPASRGSSRFKAAKQHARI